MFVSINSGRSPMLSYLDLPRIRFINVSINCVYFHSLRIVAVNENRTNVPTDTKFFTIELTPCKIAWFFIRFSCRRNNLKKNFCLLTKSCNSRMKLYVDSNVLFVFSTPSHLCSAVAVSPNDNDSYAIYLLNLNGP